MSRNKKDKKADNLPPIINKYFNDNMIEALGGKLRTENEEVDRLKHKLESFNLDYRAKGLEYIKETAAVEKALQDKTRQNIYLTNEITQIRQDRLDFEANLKEDFEKKFEVVQAEQRAVIEKVHSNMAKVRIDLEDKTIANEELIKRVDSLMDEVEKLSHAQLITIDNYERKIKELTQVYQTKLKATVEIFESFLRDNEELITTDLFTVYRKLKVKFDEKIKECIDSKERNIKLKDENKLFKFSIDNDEGILNQCALKQVKSNKKNKELREELDKTNKQIELMKVEYSKQINDFNSKFMLYIKENDTEKGALQQTVLNKNKELEELKELATKLINHRSDIEVFFIDALKDVRKEISIKKRKENEKRNGLYPMINTWKSVDDGIYLTSVQPVEIKDLDPENKEKILRALFNKLHENKTTKKYSRLRKMLS